MSHFKETERYQHLLSFLNHKVFQFKQINPKITITNLYVQNNLQSSIIKDDQFCVYVPVSIQYEFNDKLNTKQLKNYNNLNTNQIVHVKNQYSMNEILTAYGHFKLENKSILIQYDNEVDLSYNDWPEIKSIESDIDSIQDDLNQYYHEYIKEQSEQLNDLSPRFEINDDDII